MNDLPLIPLTVTTEPIGSLKPDPTNARSHSKRQIKQIAVSIEAFGFNVPLLVDRYGVIISGQGRWEAMNFLGRSHAPVIRLEHLTPEQARAFAIADNRLSDTSTWNDRQLAEHFKSLAAIELDFSLEATGFSMGEIDLRIEGLDDGDPDDNEPPAAASAPAVAKLGDVWIMDSHRLVVGDSTLPSTYDVLLREEEVHAAFSDPPYNVRVSDISGFGGRKHREFAVASGELGSDEFTGFLTTVFRLMASRSLPGAVHFNCIDHKHLREMLNAGAVAYADQLNICIWNKGMGGMGSLYRSAHEMVVVSRATPGPHRNNIELGRHGRNRTNVWSYPGANRFLKSAEDADLLRQHPTPKPVKMVADALLDVTARGDLVLDPFGGTGAVLLACQRTGRVCRTVEIDPLYADLAIRRWERHTGGNAVLERTGEAFTAVQADAEAWLYEEVV